MKKLAIITTHPIQYNAPLFRLISERNKIKIKVFYTWQQSENKVFDEKFGREIKWDIPLLEGYEYTFVKNIAKKPGSAKFYGIQNPTLIKEIKKWNADAILFFGWHHQSHFKAIRYFKNKIPVYFRGDSTLLDEKKGIKTILRRIWLKSVYHFIDIAFYVGTNNKNYYLKHGLKEKQLIFAPHSIDNERFSVKKNEYSEKAKKWRLELGYKEQDIVLQFVGKFENKKSPLFLLQVAKELKNFKFLFVGNGELEQKLKEKSKNLKTVQFLPFQNQSLMPVVYRLADIFILPSISETWGLAVNEAMACGIPVIVSNKVGCAIDLVKNNENGFVFKSGNLEDLIEKINKFDAKNLKEFKENSKIQIQKWNYLNIAKIIESTINTYQ
ncbi:MAG: glycosyltransferase family 4 protein [Bacteroidales bacterium]|nr:glycosyltransferase family 4 protein [Bacteroidales bacterium]MBN2757662.1 glycosyltransferase family 4 protein [Bacteroidales bacterium]